MGDDLVSIGQFARACRLSVSALRFYDDCGLLRPAHVDAATGYRWYHQSQLPTAALIRDLRAAEMPLPRIREVLSSGPDVAAKLLAEHDEELHRRLAHARDRLAAVAAQLSARGGQADVDERPDFMTTTCTLPAADLIAAIGQVRPSAAPPGTAPSPAAVIEGVLFEVEGGTLRLVATDRYRLAIRDLVASSVEGPDVSTIVPATELEPLEASTANGDATLVIDGDRVVVRMNGDETALTVNTSRPFPDYRKLLPEATNHRVTIAKAALAGALEGLPDDEPISFRVGAGTVDIAPIGESPGTTLNAWVAGDAITAGFNPRFLRAAAVAAVGPDVMIELTGPNFPAVVRSATDGTFTCLVMPVRLDHRDWPVNLDFAVVDEKRPGQSPTEWSAPYGEPPVLSIDSAVRTPAGGVVVAVRPLDRGDQPTMVFQGISAAPFKNKTVRWRGQVRTELTSGEAGLRVRATRGTKPIDLPGEFDGWSQKVSGTSDWTAVEVATRIPDEALGVILAFGGIGEGVMWVGDLEFSVDE